MAYGTYTYNKVQFGRETTSGTPVNATKIWRGKASMIEDDRQIKVVEEEVGLLVPAERSYVASVLGRMNLPQTELTFEQFPHILEAGIHTATPSGSGPYVYDYAFPTDTTQPAIKTYTIEAGNALVSGDHHEMAYSFVTEFELNGQKQEAWMVNSNWNGRQANQASMTSLSTLEAVQEALFQNTSFYIDATGGTVGTTQKTGVLLSARLRFRTGLVPLFTADGQLYFVSYKRTRPSVDFSIKMELESGSVVAAERAIFKSQAVRLFKLGIAGTNSRQIDITWAGKYDSISDYENDDDNTVVTFNGHAVYSQTDSLFAEIGVTNSLSTLA